MRKVFAILSLVIAAQTVAAQGQIAAIDQTEFKIKPEGFADAWKNVKNGNKLFDSDNPSLYGDALPFYLEAYKYNSTNPELNYRIGVCRLSGNDKEKALPHLQTAYRHDHALAPLLPYYLARAEMLNMMFDSAEIHFDEDTNIYG